MDSIYDIQESERGIRSGEDKGMRAKWISGVLVLFLIISVSIVSSQPGKGQGNIEKGEDLFLSKCASCHHTDSKDTKVGPGLKGIFRGKVLPVSKKPVTRENVRNQIKNPVDKMPPIPGLTEQDIRDITEYLRTL
jgi:mono/diheme cytochrome c family protein